MDVVALLDASGAQVFVTARPMKATVKESSKSMEHPLETGATIVDHRIILPLEIELSVLLTEADGPAVYQQLRAVFLRGDLLTLQTRAGSYSNLLLEAIPHDESPDMFDGLAVSVSLKEVVFVTAVYSKTAIQPASGSTHKSTVKRGEQQPKTSAQEPRKSSILGSIFR